MADKYGIPDGGDAYPGKVRYLGGNKRTLTARQLLAVLKEAGWPANSRALAAAVALAESGGHPYIYNTYKAGHFGLFQISRASWPEFFAGGSDQWADPVANARQALKVKNQQGWKAWEGYSNDSYKRYSNDVAMAALGDQAVDITTGGINGALEGGDPGGAFGLGAIGDVATGAARGAGELLGLDVWESLTKPAFWMRVGYGLTGVILIAGGLFLIVRNTPAGRAATGAAVNATPAGRVAKAAGGGKPA